jgi:hypothetical protein
MDRIRRCFLLCFVLGLVHLSAMSALGQGIELITYARPFHAHRLAGTVVDRSGASVPGVTVTVCDGVATSCNADDAHVLASVKTDENGHFAFPNLNLRQPRLIHLSMNGFDPMEARVKWRLFAPREVRLMLTVAA